MGKLIQDIAPNKPIDRQARMLRPAWKSMAKNIPTELLVSELFRRGTSIEDIFGKYYALESEATAHDYEMLGNDEEGQHGRPRLTVGDAALVSGISLPATPHKQPF